LTVLTDVTVDGFSEQDAYRNGDAATRGLSEPRILPSQAAATAHGRRSRLQPM